MTEIINTHPDEDTLVQFSEQPDDAHWSDVRLHILECDACRKKVEEFQQLTLKLKHPSMQTMMSSSELAIDELSLIRFFANDLPVQEHQRIKQLLNQDPALLKAALHMRSHISNAQIQDISNPSPRPDQAKHTKTEVSNQANRFIQKIHAYIATLLQNATPIWVSATIVMGLVLIMQLPTSHLKTAGIHITQYQDQAGITWQAQTMQPGIGFFSQADIVQDYAGIKVSWAGDNTLELTWPELENVKQYQLRLLLADTTSSIVLFDDVVRQNATKVTLNKLELSRRYEWQLLGTDTQGRQFKAQGGFVVNANKSIISQEE